MESNSLFLIDIDKIIAEKMGAKAKCVPRFVRSYLKHIVHQDELNAFLRESSDKEGISFLKACMEFLDDKVDVKGMENLPSSEGVYTFVSNHPLGALDGVAIGYIIGSHYAGKIKYLVNDILMNLRGMASLCIPINKTGSQSREFPKIVEEAFASDNHIIMFPAGVCSRRKRGKIRDLAWKKTFISESIKNRRDIVPMHFEGRNSDFFYRFANLCNVKWVKFNLAMIFLPDEMMKNRHKEFTLTIGKPISWQTFDKRKSLTEWAQYVKEMVYTL
ncbi:1-acyl-sn-glycerol-3-phosphate acyltransferase [Phocaeicola abscessus]|uniref:1-acyl-sn-glycerol-3-phosphate acyltransferase n=1 Tax=Phocaeicola abscessus TaxID=555313 RepID=UPI0003868946|nr:1-acyl-sn-glycerol-3-phosphate acyltransferase [Phocaeicola abscessus]EPT32862.1 acyltransferase [Bacteroidetes bacterium oral taxon 272 str. F0290]